MTRGALPCGCAQVTSSRREPLMTMASDGERREVAAGLRDMRGDCKGCALKVLEEASEAVGAWKAKNRAHGRISKTSE